MAQSRSVPHAFSVVLTDIGTTTRERTTRETRGDRGVDFVSIEGDTHVGTSLTAVSLFSGAGGLDIGLEAAGFRTLGCVETDRDCRATLAANRPKWRLLNGPVGELPGDVRFLRGEDVWAQTGLCRGQLDLVAGGPPCQSFSNLGLKRGQDDPVNGGLFSEYLRLVGELLPKGFLFENVEGFNHSRHAMVRQYLFQGLEGLGYRFSAKIVNAADYGDPQIRRRFVVLGVLGGHAPQFPAPTHFATRERHAAFFESANLEPTEFRPYATVAGAFRSLAGRRRSRIDDITMGVSERTSARMKYVKAGENFKALPDELRPDCWKSGRHQGADTFGRLWADRPSVTIRTSAYNVSKGRYIHPHEDRGLSTMEMAALQSFPEDWVFQCAGKQSLVGIGRMIGNAVPVRLARALGLAMRSSLAARD